MTIFHGRNTKILINAVDLSGDVNAVTVQSEQDLADVTTFGNVGHSFYPGMAKDSCTIEGLYASTEAAVFNGLLQATSGYGVMIALAPTYGAPAYATQETMLISNGIKSVVTDVNRINVSLDVDNYPFEPSIMLSAGVASVNLTSTFAQLSVVTTSGTSATTGGAGYLQVVAVSTSTLYVVISQSSTGAFAGEHTNACVFTEAASSETQRIAITSQLQPYYRVAYRSGTGTGAAMLAVAIAKYQ